MALPGRALLQSLLHRSSIAFLLLIATLLAASWVLIADGTQGLRQAAMTTATQSIARAALALKDEMLAIEGRLLAVQREGRPIAGIGFAPLGADVSASLVGAEAGQLRFWPLPEGAIAFLVPVAPGAPTAFQRVSASALAALITPLAGSSLRLVTGLGTELAATASGHTTESGDIRTSVWLREGVLRLDASAAVGAVSPLVWLIPLFGLGTLGFIFRGHLERTQRMEMKLAALRASLARHAAQLSVNEARMRLAQTERLVTERRETILIEAWPAPVALADQAERITAWNEAFAALLPHGALRRDLPIGMLGRHLDLRSAKSDNGRRAPGNRPRVRVLPLPDGGRLLQGLTETTFGPAAVSPLAQARELCREEMLVLALRLREGVAAGEGATTREVAHAIRGLAANFGLTALLPQLVLLEHSAQAGDAGAMREALAGFEREFVLALRQLGQPAA